MGVVLPEEILEVLHGVDPDHLLGLFEEGLDPVVGDATPGVSGTNDVSLGWRLISRWPVGSVGANARKGGREGGDS